MKCYSCFIVKVVWYGIFFICNGNIIICCGNISVYIVYIDINFEVFIIVEKKNNV